MIDLIIGFVIAGVLFVVEYFLSASAYSPYNKTDHPEDILHFPAAHFQHFHF